MEIFQIKQVQQNSETNQPGRRMAHFLSIQNPYQLFATSYIEKVAIFSRCFLPINKSRTTYKKHFRILIELNRHPTPTKKDFEQGSGSAAGSLFPTAQIPGRIFHFRWVLQHRIAEEGLKEYCKYNFFAKKHTDELMAWHSFP